MVKQLWAVGESENGEIIDPVPLHGWEIDLDANWMLVLKHRCGVELDLRPGAYLPDVITGPVADHHRQGCSS